MWLRNPSKRHSNWTVCLGIGAAIQTMQGRIWKPRKINIVTQTRLWSTDQGKTIRDQLFKTQDKLTWKRKFNASTCSNSETLNQSGWNTDRRIVGSWNNWNWAQGGDNWETKAKIWIHRQAIQLLWKLMWTKLEEDGRT